MEKKNKVNAVAIGSFLFVGLLLLAVLVFIAGKYNVIFGGGYTLQVEYTFLDNLQPGAKVKVLGGPNIGQVNEINFKDGKIVITLFISGKYKINRGATFSIYSTSLVGQKYINVANYDPTKTDLLTNNEYIYGVNPLGFAKVLELAGSAIKSVTTEGSADTMNKVKDAFQNTAELIDGLNKLVKDNAKPIGESVTKLNASMKSTTEAIENINIMIKQNQESVKDSIAKLNHAIQQIDQIAVSIKAKTDVIDEKRLDTIMNNIVQVSSDLKKLSALPDDKSSILSWTKDKDFKTRMDNIIANLETVSKKMKEQGLLYSGSK
jgi:phospholipid/cholesterol/gamma-HCH transport system substrate-binding protein